MHERLLEILACPDCNHDLTLNGAAVERRGHVETGTLDCSKCSRSYPITGGVPRLRPVEPEPGADMGSRRTVARFETSSPARGSISLWPFPVILSARS